MTTHTEPLLLRPQDGDVPHAAPNPLSAPFWESCARGVLTAQVCGACGAWNFPPGELCRTCHGRDLAWRPASGLGTVYSFTVVWRPATPAFTTPYAPAIVDLDEGCQVLTNLVNLTPDAVAVGLRVRVVFHACAAGLHLPYFEPAD